MKKSFVLFSILALFVFSADLVLALSWQTEPILGTGGVDVTGDLVMITGPTPTTSGGGSYYDVDGNVVLGPTIPHYSIVGDPLFNVGSPSMTSFIIHPTAYDGAHYYDPNLQIHAGSGINLEASHIYTYEAKYSFLGTPGNPAYDAVAAQNSNFTGYDFIMLHTWLYGLWLEDAGNWIYTETWTDNAGGSPITSSRSFSVSVPEPATMLLLGLGLVGLAGFRRRMK